MGIRLSAALVVGTAMLVAGCGGGDDRSGGGTAPTPSSSAPAPSPSSAAPSVPSPSTQAPLPRAPASTPKTVKIPVAAETKVTKENLGLIASGLGAIWITDGDNDLVKVDPATGRPLWSKKVVGLFVGTGFGSVWVVDYNDGVVNRADPTTGKVVATIDVGDSPEGIVPGGDSMWVALHHDRGVARIDPSTNKVVDTVEGLAPGKTNGPQFMSADQQHVYTGSPATQSVYSIDVDTGKATPFSVAPDSSACGPLTLDGPVVWAGACLDNSNIVRIDTASGATVVSQDLRTSCSEGVVRGGLIWFDCFTDKPGSGSLVALDRQSGAEVATAAIPDISSDAVVVGDAWWVMGREGKLLRIDLRDLPDHP